MIDAFLDWLIKALTPDIPPDDMMYCPECGGTMFNKYYQVCARCHGTGYVKKQRHEIGGIE